MHVWPPLMVAAELLVAIGLVYAVARMKKPGALTPLLNLFALILIAMPIYHHRRGPDGAAGRNQSKQRGAFSLPAP